MRKIFILAAAALALQTSCSNDKSNEVMPAPNGATNESMDSNGVKNVEKVASFPGAQVTGITVAADGRTFASFPRWREGVTNSVVEIFPDGRSQPYPTPEWNAYAGQPQPNTFTCVQSVVAHGGSLFVLDPASPELKGVVGTPTLYEFDLATNSLKNKYTFGPDVAPAKSYLNDLRVDDEHGKIYLTESGLGAIIVLDTKTGRARRVLDGDASTKTEELTLYVDGKPFVEADGTPRRFQVDGIALRDGYLYYHAITSRHLYRIPTKLLAKDNLSARRLAKAVEDLGETPLPDGMIFDDAGNLFMADLERNAVVYRNSDGAISNLIQDPNLHWADTFAIDPRGFLLFTDSRLNEAAPGQPAAGLDFPIYRVALPGRR